ncbi:hypothetical protein ACOME3_003367 [Neoechinorhynchus agilis]
MQNPVGAFERKMRKSKEDIRPTVKPQILYIFSLDLESLCSQPLKPSENEGFQKLTKIILVLGIINLLKYEKVMSTTTRLRQCYLASLAEFLIFTHNNADNF